MDDLQATGVIIALFALRCVAPLAITITIGYLMNRLVDRWQAEDIARQEGPEVPEVESVPAIKLPSITVPCWILRNCEQAKQAECPARQQPSLPCWLVRLRSDGKLPETCPDCVLYGSAVAAAD